MNKEVKEKWINALRSGEYEQTRMSLCNDGKFCCLGVLCDIYAKEKNISWEESNSVCFKGEKKILGESTLLPIEVMEYSGIDKSKSLFFCGNSFNILVDLDDIGNGTLSELNDSGYTFKQIADIIEKKL